MNNNEFYQRTEGFYQECIQIMKTKGGEYAGSEDKFANFKRLSGLQQISPLSIWFTYFTKHFDSLTSFIRRVNKGESVAEVDASLSEPISGRIGDMINYLFILKGMIEEEKSSVKPQT